MGGACLNAGRSGVVMVFVSIFEISGAAVISVVRLYFHIYETVVKAIQKLHTQARTKTGIDFPIFTFCFYVRYVTIQTNCNAITALFFAPIANCKLNKFPQGSAI